MMDFTRKVSFPELFDSLYYLNKMAKVVAPKNRLISNSLFYKIKTAIIEELISYADFYNLSVEVKSIDSQTINNSSKEINLLNIIISNDENHFECHQEETPQLVSLLQNFGNIDLDSVPTSQYSRQSEMPEFDETRYSESYINMMSYVRNSPVFYTMWNSNNWSIYVRLNFLKMIYPEINIVTMKKLHNNNSDTGIIADVYVNNIKTKYCQQKLGTICARYIPEVIKLVNKRFGLPKK